VKDTLYIQLNDDALDILDGLPSLGGGAKDVAPDTLSEPSEDLFARNTVQWLLASDGVASGSEGIDVIDDLVDSLLDSRGGMFGLDIVLILQGVHIFSTAVNIPSKQNKHIAQALPFMLEDNVASDVEELHFVPGHRNNNGDVGVLATKKTVLDLLTTHFSRAGLPLTAIVPDMSCLPFVEGEWVFITDGHQLTIRTSEYQAMSIELDALPILLNSLFTISEGTEPPEKLIVRVTQEFKSDNFENWLKTQITSHLVDIDTELDMQHVETSEFLYLCDSISDQCVKMNNLLTGDYKPVPKRAPSLFNWKPMASLFSILIVMLVGFQYMHASQLEKQAMVADSEAKALYRKYFPKDKRVFDVRKQMKSHLMKVDTSSSSTAFLPLLAQVGEKMNEMNRASKNQVFIPLRISFDEVQGELKVDCKAPGFEALDSLKKKLESLQLGVEIARASQDGEQVKARINVRSSS